MGIKNVARRVHRWRRRPRFRTPKLWLLLSFLLVAALLLLPRGTRPPAAPEPLPASPPHSDASPSPSSIDIQEGTCPQGCASPPPGCVIKGNISQKTGERIYHLPGQRYYDKTIIVPEDGEAWFCTEAEARANRWRKSKV